MTPLRIIWRKSSWTAWEAVPWITCCSCRFRITAFLFWPEQLWILPLIFHSRYKWEEAGFQIPIQVHDPLELIVAFLVCFWQVNDTDFGHMMYNASLPWEELIHPWVTCARVSLTRQMPDDVMKITRSGYLFFLRLGTIHSSSLCSNQF